MATKDTTPDLSEFHSLSNPQRAICAVGTVLEGKGEQELTNGEREQLAAALASPVEVITHVAVSKWLSVRKIQDRMADRGLRSGT